MRLQSAGLRNSCLWLQGVLICRTFRDSIEQVGDHVCGFLLARSAVVLCYSLEPALEHSPWCSPINLGDFVTFSTFPVPLQRSAPDSTSTVSGTCVSLAFHSFLSDFYFILHCLCFDLAHVFELVVEAVPCIVYGLEKILLCVCYIALYCLQAHLSLLKFLVEFLAKALPPFSWHMTGLFPPDVWWSPLTRAGCSVLWPPSSLDVHPSWLFFTLAFVVTWLAFNSAWLVFMYPFISLRLEFI